LFLDYLTLAIHGVTAYGGVFMIDYLPALLTPAAQILEIEFPGFRSMADFSSLDESRANGVNERLSENPHTRQNARDLSYRPYLAAGLLPLGREEPSSPFSFSAVGALELFSLGPFSSRDLVRLASLTVGESWPFTAAEWYQEETPLSLREPSWEKSGEAPAMIL
jgi:hypothetical protein